MNKYISKENRISNILTNKGQKINLILNAIYLILFILASFAMFKFIYVFCNLVGAVVSGAPYEMIHEIKRMFPVLLLQIGLITLSFICHILSRSHNEKERSKTLFKSGIAMIAIGSISLVYFIVGLISNTYESLLESYPTLLFPLDYILLSIILLCIGIFFIVKKEFVISMLNEIPFEVEDKRKKVVKVLANIGISIVYFLILYAFSAFWYGLFIIDFKHGHVFYAIMLLLVLLFSFLEFFQFKFIYLGLKQEIRNEYLLKTSRITLIVNICIYLLWIVSMLMDHNGLNQAAYGVLAIEFTASVSIGTYLYFIVLVILPLIFYIIANVRNKKHD